MKNQTMQRNFLNVCWRTTGKPAEVIKRCKVAFKAIGAGRIELAERIMSADDTCAEIWALALLGE